MARNDDASLNIWLKQREQEEKDNRSRLGTTAWFVLFLFFVVALVVNHSDKVWLEKQNQETKNKIQETYKEIGTIPDSSFLLMRDGRTLFVVNRTASYGILYIKRSVTDSGTRMYLVSPKRLSEIGRVVKPSDSDYMFHKKSFFLDSAY